VDVGAVQGAALLVRDDAAPTQCQEKLLDLIDLHIEIGEPRDGICEDVDRPGHECDAMLECNRTGLRGNTRGVLDRAGKLDVGYGDRDDRMTYGHSSLQPLGIQGIRAGTIGHLMDWPKAEPSKAGL